MIFFVVPPNCFNGRRQGCPSSSSFGSCRFSLYPSARSAFKSPVSVVSVNNCVRIDPLITYNKRKYLISFTPPPLILSLLRLPLLSQTAVALCSDR